jgi:hypothetical protein
MSTSSYPLLYAAPCLAQRPRFHVHFTPTCASWITLVERCLPCSQKVSSARCVPIGSPASNNTFRSPTRRPSVLLDPGCISPARNEGRRASRGHNSTTHVAFPNAAWGCAWLGECGIVSPATSGSTSAVLPFLRCYYCLSERERERERERGNGCSVSGADSSRRCFSG